MLSLWKKCKFMIISRQMVSLTQLPSVNIVQGTKQLRDMITGKYLVGDIRCHQCGNLVGWKYHHSEVKNQKYKEGKYILELQTIVRCK